MGDGVNEADWLERLRGDCPLLPPWLLRPVARVLADPTVPVDVLLGLADAVIEDAEEARCGGGAAIGRELRAVAGWLRQRVPAR